jgi:hypothetical protein
MKRSALYAPIALAAMLAASLAASAQSSAPASDLVPAGRTLSYLEVSDWSQAKAALDATDFGQAFATLRPFFDHLLSGVDEQIGQQKQQFEQQFGAKFDDVLAILRGGFALAAVDTAPNGGQPQIMPVAVFPAAGKPTIAALVDHLKQQQGQNAPPFYLIDRGASLAVTLDQNALLTADGAGATGPALSADPMFQSIRRRTLGEGQPVIFAYVNVAALVDRSPLGRDPEQRAKLDAAGLGGAKAAGLALAAEGGRIREALAIAAPGEKKGVAKMLSTGQPLDLARLSETIPGDTLWFAALRLDAGSLFDEFFALVEATDGPQARARLEKDLADFEQEFGMQVRADLLAPLGDLLTVDSSVPDDGLLPEAVFSITVKDAQKVQTALAQLAEKAGFQVASVERGGRRISYLQAPLGKLGEDPTRGMTEDALGAQAIVSGVLSAWTIDKGRLYFASLPQALEDRFERLAKGSLAENEAFKQAMAKAPAGARMFSWGRTRPIAGIAYQVALKALRAFEPMVRRAGVAVDTALLPRATTFASPFRPASSAFTADPDGFLLVMHGGLPVLTTVPLLAGVGAALTVKQREEAKSMQVEFELRTLAYAEASWKMEKGSYTASTEDLVKSGQIDPDFEMRAMQAGYRFIITKADAEGFTIVAKSLRPGKPTLMVDETMDVRPYGMPSRHPREPEEGMHEEPDGPPARPGAEDPHPGGGATVADPEAHALFQAAAMTGDQAVIMDVYRKLGFMKEDGSIENEKLQKFASEHGTWAQSNVPFIQEMQDPEKARAYVHGHMK